MTTKSDAECEEAIKEFAELTGTDEAYAHFVLQDLDFDLEAGVYKYFAELNPDAPLPDKMINEVKEAKATQNSNDTLPDELTIISWNIDGLDQGNRSKRFDAVLVNPEVIFFQEFVPDLEARLNSVLGQVYNIFYGNQSCAYYTCTLVSKNIHVNECNVVRYNNSTMGRNLMVVNGLNLKLLNTHLESEKAHADVRKQQFKRAIGEAKSGVADNTLVIFGGDLNIRDSEISSLPDGLKDCWAAAGSYSDSKFTWDMLRNDNKEFPADKRKFIRLRFDRLYYNGPYQKVDFFLEGTQRIKAIHRFPSDHFAICCKFSIPRAQ